MTENTKITLSAKELELVCNTGWILTKHEIIQKVYQLFGTVLPNIESILKTEQQNLPEDIFINPAKISKGENYHQLPYVMLDYPRYFTKEASIAIRTFFWWGNFFSVTLQLSGKHKNEVIPRLLNNFNYLQQNNFWLCVNESEWEHHFDASNFKLVKELTKEEFTTILLREPFIKMAKKISLQQWQDAPAFITQSFEEMIRLLKKY